MNGTRNHGIHPFHVFFFRLRLACFLSTPTKTLSPNWLSSLYSATLRSRAVLISYRYGDSEEKIKMYITLMTAYGISAGIHYKFGGTVANTLQAHRVIQYFQEN